MDRPADQIRSLAENRGARLGDSESQRLVEYAEALVVEGRDINLSAARTLHDVLEVLVGPSFALAQAWVDDAPPAVVVDIGSGNGFPGVVAASLWPDADVVLVERRRKKAAAIGRCLERSGLRARVLACDAREVPREEPGLLGSASLVTARGVGTLDGVNRLAGPLLARRGLVVHFKAFALAPEERETARANEAKAGVHLSADIAFEPGPPGPGRLLCFRRGRGPA